MKLKLFTEQILTVLLVVVVLPWMLTMLLHSKMNQIYEKIQSETRYISVKSGEETEEISLEEYVLEVTAAELPADAQEEAVKAQMVLIRTNAYRQLMEGFEKRRKKQRDRYLPVRINRLWRHIIKSVPVRQERDRKSFIQKIMSI